MCWHNALESWGQKLLGCWRVLNSTYSLSTFHTWRGFPPFRNFSTYNAVTNKCASDVKKEKKGDKQTKEINHEKKNIHSPFFWNMIRPYVTSGARRCETGVQCTTKIFNSRWEAMTLSRIFGHHNQWRGLTSH